MVNVYIKHQISEYLKELVNQDWYNRLDESKKQEIEIMKTISPYAIITTNYDIILSDLINALTTNANGEYI